MEPNFRNKTIFVDTSAFIALILQSEPHHQITVDCFKKYLSNGARLITIDYVLDELFTYLRCRKKVNMEVILNFIKSSYASGIKIFAISESLFGDALKFMRQYDDHFFSCTDCVSFLVMKELKIRDVFTFDNDFKIAGFNNLLEVGL